MSGSNYMESLIFCY